jgi:O-antigen/teichoic acid export membrane protein
MVTFGFMLSISGLITLGTSYLIRIYISNTGGVDHVGLYSAGFAIINTYVGMVFTAMSIDYFPRLAGIAHDNKKTSELINQQSEIAILILAPILTIFIVFIQYVVILLFSTKFIPVNGMIQWAAMGMYFKAVSWAIAYIILAKGASRLFFWNELIASIYILVFNIMGYRLAGFDGLGISFLIGYIVYLIQVFFIARIRYGFYFQSEFFKIFIIQLAIGIVCFSIIRFLKVPLSYFAGGIIIIFSSLISINELDKRLGLKEIIASLRKRY